MKKFISVLLSIFIMCSTLFMSGCDGDTLHTFWSIMGHTCENHDYLDLYDEELKTIVYNGNAYYIESLDRVGFDLVDPSIIVGRTVNLYGACVLWYKSEKDVNADVLTVDYTGSVYVREGAILPKSIYDCQFSSITLCKYNNTKEVTLENDAFAFPLKLDDLLEYAPQMEVDYNYRNVYIEVEIEGYPYLTSWIQVFNFNGDIYLQPISYSNEFRRVKVEYQEVFKKALAEFAPFEDSTAESVG